MSRKSPLLVLPLVCCLLISVGGCKKKTQPETMPEPTATSQPATPPPPPAPKTEVREDFPKEPVEKTEMPRITSSDLDRMLQTVYFAFDQYDLSDETRSTLQSNANVLQKNRDFNVVIEGHCDERGTIEYNLALGEKRARAVRDYLVSLGLSPSRLRIVSYGEERPAASGHNEAAWAKNRRAEFRAEQ